MDPFTQMDNIAVCEECGRAFTNAKRLYRHLFDVHNMSKQALREFQTQRRLKKIAQEAVTRERPVYSCEYCQKPYLSKLGLSNHMVKEHGHTKSSPASIDFIVCPVSTCGMRFQTYFDLSTHADVAHRDMVIDSDVFQIHRRRFADYDKFHEWKQEQEQQTESRFFTRSTETKIRYGRKVWLMKCLHTQKTSKTVAYYHDHCPAFIRVCERFSGEYEVVSCFGHLGHPHFTQNNNAIEYLKQDFDLDNGLEMNDEYPESMKLGGEEEVDGEEYACEEETKNVMMIKQELEDEEEEERMRIEEEMQPRCTFSSPSLPDELGEFLEIESQGLLEG